MIDDLVEIVIATSAPLTLLHVEIPASCLPLLTKVAQMHPDELMFDIYCCKFQNLSGLDIKSPPRVASGLRLKTVIYPLL